MDTDVGVMPVWSLNADCGIVDLVDAETVVAVLVDEHPVRTAASTTAATAEVSSGTARGDGSVRSEVECIDVSPPVVFLDQTLERTGLSC
jgi:hypothetical protein